MVQTTLAGPRASTPGGTSHDEVPVTPADDDANLGTLVFRVSNVESGLRDVRDDIKAMRSEVRTGLANLSFVGKDLYVSEQAAQNERIATAVTLAMWALGLVCALVVGAIVTAIATVVG